MPTGLEGCADATGGWQGAFQVEGTVRAKQEFSVFKCLGQWGAVTESFLEYVKVFSPKLVEPLIKYFYSSKSKPLFLVVLSSGSKNSTDVSYLGLLSG